MGQKVHPHGLRVGVIKDWDSRWFMNDSDFGDNIVEDDKIRKFVKKALYQAGVAKIEIEKKANKVTVFVHAAKPGIVIGKGGADIEKHKKALQKLTGEEIYLNIVEVKNPDLSAALVAESIALQIQNRASFRAVQKRAIRNTMKAGAVGIKVAVSGRLAGAEMARTEGYTEGTVPLHTLRADIDYAHKEDDTIYGKIGVKVWIYKGEILPAKKNKGGKKDVNSKEN